MFTRLTLATAFALTTGVAFAQDAQATKAQALYDVMAFDALLDVMRTEGITYGGEVGQDLFPDRVDARWTDVVSTIYDVDAMRSEILDNFTASLEQQDADIDTMIAFFDSEPGRTFISLEISARQALLDDAVEEASKESAAMASIDGTERFKMVESFVEINDLVETNVVGAMNANYAFYTGLLDGGAFGTDLTEDQILSDVWSQEGEIRNSTTEWVYSFLMMAYQPASDDDLAAYIAFSESDAGQELNAALFVAFDGMFADISRALGLASSQFMTGAEL